jgi:hypothetical protein
MDALRSVRKTDLARNTRQVINAVLRGQMTVVESHGQPEVAIMDILDYHIMRAALRYHSQEPEIDVDAGLSDQDVELLADPQARFDHVLAHYLGGAISLGRAAELLGLPWLDLRTRFLRLDVPVRVSPEGLDEPRAGVKAASAWPATRR